MAKREKENISAVTENEETSVETEFADNTPELVEGVDYVIGRSGERITLTPSFH